MAINGENVDTKKIKWYFIFDGKIMFKMFSNHHERHTSFRYNLLLGEISSMFNLSTLSGLCGYPAVVKMLGMANKLHLLTDLKFSLFPLDYFLCNLDYYLGTNWITYKLWKVYFYEVKLKHNCDENYICRK